eukprot:TRINITY_DN196_c0_g1_i2.p1 TRINITY_DN196_c0_g1~~TRINITY_DN196_c0_g1_i2.p1  ORF type:complete len:793 (+),score=349.08 TRINITY_DN196_c0_g1_i2:64-2442(+)
MKSVAVAALLALAGPCDAVWSYGPDSFNCKMRALAYEFGKKNLDGKFGQFESLYYALGLNDDCTDYVKPPTFTPADLTPAPPTFPSGAGVNYYVDYAKGSDGNAGTSVGAPLKSIQAAVDKASRGAVINLRAGTHYLAETVQFTPQHSGVTVQNYNGEAVTVSGGLPLDTKWSQFKVGNGSNIYVTDVPAGVTVPGLQVGGVRATRARYPNGNVELPERSQEAGDPNGVQMIPAAQGEWVKADLSKQGTQEYVENENPAQMRNDTDYGFNKYMVGIGGPCDVYDPPVSYWCAKDTKGGGAFPFRVPRGVRPTAEAGLHMPYAHPEDATMFVWRPARWANWMFEVAKVNDTNQIWFGKGGFQGARGENTGGDWFVENVFEELDYPNEFFHDKRASKLYFYHNASNYAPPPAEAEYLAPQLLSLFNLTSTRWNPIKDVTIRGLKLTGTRFSYMEPHGVPSGGDWALERRGAVFLEGTEGVHVTDCHLTRLDGNAVMISKYNRNATVERNEFSWIGGSGVASWGFTNETGANPLEGFDGTDGNHPRYNTIRGNLIREVGHYEKQTSFYVQAKTALTVLENNVFFNGPRAGINFNDGFGGGDVVASNLVFSSCRESGDHGPFNSWDRQPFLTDVRTPGVPSVVMQWRTLRNNFFIDNYNTQEGVDNDDGSAFYDTHHNFLVAGNVGMKNDFGGHDNHHHDNLYAYVKEGFGICSQLAGHEDWFCNSTLVMTGTSVGHGDVCSGPGMTNVHDLTVYTPTGTATECGHSPPRSHGTTVAKLPADEVIIALGKKLIWRW